MHTLTPAPPYDEAVPRKPKRNRVFREDDDYYLAAQMDAAVNDDDLANDIRALIRKKGRGHIAAARAALPELEAKAPPGKPPTRAQIEEFLEQYRDEYRKGQA